MSETWRAIPDWEMYEVSDLGRVRRLKGNDVRNRKWGGKILKSKNNGGSSKRDRVTLHDGDRKWAVFVSRLVLLAFRGQPPKDRPFACHKNNDPKDNCLNNLYWGSHHENMKDAVKNDKILRGSKHGNSKLTEKDVEYIFKMYEPYVSGRSMIDLASFFNVSVALISKILTKQNWKHADQNRIGSRRGAAKGRGKSRKIHSEEQISSFRLAFRSGSTYEELSQILGCPRDSVRYWADKYGESSRRIIRNLHT